MATSSPRRSKSKSFYSSKNNFWSIGGYNIALKRLENGKELCHDLQVMLDERAAIEEKYAAKLKSWSNQWYTKIQSNGEYGSSKVVWLEALKEGKMTSNKHSNYHIKIKETSAKVHSWRKSIYQKSGTLQSTYKIVDQIKERFKAAEKQHKKTMDSLKGLWKTYHDVETEFQRTKDKYNAAMAKHDTEGTARYEKRANDSVKHGEGLIREMQQVMVVLETGKEKYMKNMSDQYQLTDDEEMKRKDFFKKQLMNYLQHFQNQRGADRGNMLKSIDDIFNPKTDVINWSLQHGPGQDIEGVWPVIPDSCSFNLYGNAAPIKPSRKKYAKRTETIENKNDIPPAEEVEPMDNTLEESFWDDFSSDDNLDATYENINTEPVEDGTNANALKPVEDYQLYEAVDEYAARGLEELSLSKGEQLVMVYKYSEELNYFEKQEDSSCQGYVPMAALTRIN
ncbi:unnamed protein product [Owenia fusiformis]|uniref:Uncharacterized protein n=1 Tax=Owenia fusiformis TaxID=6347 RepID=A0A8J1U253_OWEFU|nr:unnamed protein product [Owenia fusiformis]